MLGSTEVYPGSGISEGTENPEKLAEGVIDSEVRGEEVSELAALVAVDSAVEFAALVGVDRIVGGEESGAVECVPTEDRDAVEGWVDAGTGTVKVAALLAVAASFRATTKGKRAAQCQKAERMVGREGVWIEKHQRRRFK